jgi:hypothetical protein
MPESWIDERIAGIPEDIEETWWGRRKGVFGTQ